MSIKLRKANRLDRQAMLDVVLAAFGDEEGQEITDLTSDLLDDSSAQPLLSLVAMDGDHIVGHILFTNVRISQAQKKVSSSILAPLSVHPEYQNQGVSGQLIKEGLNQLRQTGVGPLLFH